MKNEKFRISDPYLAQAMTYGDGLERISDLGRGWPYSKENPAYAFVLLLVRHLFHFYRWPGYEDRMLCGNMLSEKARSFFASLDQKQVDRSAAALKEVYEVSQEYLSTQFGDEPIPLVRGLRLQNADFNENRWAIAADIAVRANVAECKGKDRIEIQMDTLNSFSKTLSSYPGYSGCDLHFRFHRTDILFCAEAIDGMEGNEWIAINNHPRGIVSMPVTDVVPEPWLKEVVKSKSMGDRSDRDSWYNTPYVPPFNCSRSVRAPLFVRLAHNFENWRQRS